MRLAVLALIVLTLVACSASPSGTTSGPVTVAPGITLALPMPAELGQGVEAVQLVTARRGGESFVFECRLSVDSQRLLLVGSDSMGRRAMSVRWGQDGITVEQAEWLPSSVRPENILADIILLHWPEDSVRRGLAGATLTQTPQGRRIGEAIAISWQADPWNGLSRLVNTAWGYEIEVRSVRVSP